MFQKVIIIVMIAFLAAPAFSQPALKIDSPVPSFTLSNLKGEAIPLDQYLGKKVIILSFFASWSRSCQQELFFLKYLYENRGLKIIGVSFDRKLNDLKSFINENQIEFEILHDNKLTTLKDFRILIIPTLLVIDKEGNLKNIYVDFDQNVEKAVSKEIQKLLAPI